MYWGKIIKLKCRFKKINGKSADCGRSNLTTGPEARLLDFVD